MEKFDDYIMLKFGRLKGYKIDNSQESLDLLNQYDECSEIPLSDKAKSLLCEAIDKLNGRIINWWDQNDDQAKEEAKQYILNYK